MKGGFSHEKLIEFFKALVADGQRAGKTVFLFLDNLSVYHCKPVKDWVAEHKARVEVFYLSSDSPELNSDERRIADLGDSVRFPECQRTAA